MTKEELEKIRYVGGETENKERVDELDSKIWELLCQIRDIYYTYESPKNGYLSMSIYGNTLNVSNNYWENSRYAVSLWKNFKEEE